jgi:hypothetical protein
MPAVPLPIGAAKSARRLSGPRPQFLGAGMPWLRVSPKPLQEFESLKKKQSRWHRILWTLVCCHPFDSRLRYWMHPNRYEECQTLAELARNAGIQMIKYASVRDRYNRPNRAISSCPAFTDTEPITPQTWRLLFGSNGARALREMPSEAIDFDRRAFAVDPRILKMRWNR